MLLFADTHHILTLSPALGALLFGLTSLRGRSCIFTLLCEKDAVSWACRRLLRVHQVRSAVVKLLLLCLKENHHTTEMRRAKCRPYNRNATYEISMLSATCVRVRSQLAQVHCIGRALLLAGWMDVRMRNSASRSVHMRDYTWSIYLYTPRAFTFHAVSFLNRSTSFRPTLRSTSTVQLIFKPLSR